MWIRLLDKLLTSKWTQLLDSLLATLHGFVLLKIVTSAVQRQNILTHSQNDILKISNGWIQILLGAKLFSSSIFSKVSLNRPLEEVQHYCFS